MRRYIEPQEKAPLRTAVAVTALQHGAGNVEVLPVKRPALLDMRLVGPSSNRYMLDRKRHLWAGDVAEAGEGRDESGVSGNES